MMPNIPKNHQNAISDAELLSAKQAVKLLQTQIKTGRIDLQFLDRQLGKLDDLLARFESSRGENKKAGRFEALYNVSRALGSSLELQTVLNQVMDAIIQLTGAERGFLMLQDYEGELRVKAARNIDQQTLSTDAFKYSTTVANQVLDSGNPVLTTNAAEDPRFAGQASIVAQSLRSIMATPLRARGNVIGVVYVDSRVSAGLFVAADLEALEALAAQAAVAIDNAMLFNATDQELTRRLEELRQLRRIDLLLSETLDADEAIKITLEWACRVGSAITGHLGLIRDQKIPLTHSYGERDPHSASATLDALYPQSWDVIRAGQAQGFTLTEPEACSVYIVPIRRENKPIGVVVLERDGDRAFNAEEIDMVERVVARAAISIENARLYAEVQAADRAKTEFVGVVAHDLKAPMTGISGYAELLLMRGSLTERQEDYVRKIRDAVHRMEMLVSDLADISRIESGHFLMEETRVPVMHVIQSLKDTTLPQIIERQHEFVELIDNDLPDMHTDYYRLLQVLVNLVSNAYKYTPNGGKITLEARRENGRIRFAVADTGIGMDDGALAKLGTKFWRAEDHFTRAQPGTGLGFSITRSLIVQMGSQMEIDSKPGAGSRFAFTVAIAKDG